MATKTPAFGIDFGKRKFKMFKNDDKDDYFFISLDDSRDVTKIRRGFIDDDDHTVRLENPTRVLRKPSPYNLLFLGLFKDSSGRVIGNTPSYMSLEGEDNTEEEISRFQRPFDFGAEEEKKKLPKGLAASDITVDRFAKITLLDDSEHLDQMLKTGQVSGMEQQMVVGGAEGMEMEGD